MNAMIRHLRLILLLLCTLLLPSCLERHITIHLNKDGSGTIVMDNLMGPIFLAWDEGCGEFPAPDGKKQASRMDRLLSEDIAKKIATELGEGVTYAKVEPITKGEWKGSRTTFNFKNINKLKIGPDTVFGEMDSKYGPDDRKPRKNPAHAIAFDYKAGELAIRTNLLDSDKPAYDLLVPDEPANEKPATVVSKRELSARQKEGMSMMLAGAKASLKLVIAPGISETTASHREGNTITLAEMDIHKFVTNDKVQEQLDALKPQGQAVYFTALSKVEGVKLEVKEEIKVKIK